MRCQQTSPCLLRPRQAWLLESSNLQGRLRRRGLIGGCPASQLPALPTDRRSVGRRPRFERMGCGQSTGRQVPREGTLEPRASYEKVSATPGGTLTRTRGYHIDARIPANTPNGTAAPGQERRDYGVDPLSFGEVLAIEQACERTRQLAGTPLALRKWSRIVLQTPTSSRALNTDTGERELRVPLPAEASGGAELVVETPRGTLVDVVVPSGVQVNSGQVLTVSYRDTIPRASNSPSGEPPSPVPLLSLPPSKRRAAS